MRNEIAPRKTSVGSLPWVSGCNNTPYFSYLCLHSIAYIIKKGPNHLWSSPFFYLQRQGAKTGLD